MKNAEEVLDFLLSSISLGSYDRRFLSNLQMTNVLTRTPITSNQAELFKKVIRTYTRQIFKYGFIAEELRELAWSLKIIQSSEEYTKVQLKIQNSDLILRTPYNAAFIKDYRNSKTILKWDPNNKFYIGKFGIAVLKHTLDAVRKYYNDVVCCNEVTKILTEIEFYADCKYWNPTLVRRNTRLFIVACNDELYNALSHIELKADLPTLARLVGYGVYIDMSVANELVESMGNDQAARDAVNFAINKECILEINQLDQLKSRLESIGCDHITVTNRYTGSPAKEQIEQIINDMGIPNQTAKVFIYSGQQYNREYQMPVTVTIGRAAIGFAASPFITKKIAIVDSTPINLEQHERV
ncbi:MAG: hypothetical protein ACOVLB_00045 [Candidatus Nanopelagicus sp.]